MNIIIMDAVLALGCRVDRITWKRADERPILSDASSLSDFGRRLTILSAKSSDSGNYSCTAHYESRVDGSDAGTPTKTYVQLIVTTQLSVTGGEAELSDLRKRTVTDNSP